MLKKRNVPALREVLNRKGFAKWHGTCITTRRRFLQGRNIQEESMQMNRRQFFKICSAGLGGSSIAVMGFSPTAALAEVRAFKLARATENAEYLSVLLGSVRSSGVFDRRQVENSKGTIIHVEGDPDNPVNRGTLCPKGAGVRDMMQSRIASSGRKYASPAPTSGSAFPGTTRSSASPST